MTDDMFESIRLISESTTRDIEDELHDRVPESYLELQLIVPNYPDSSNFIGLDQRRSYSNFKGT